MAYKVYWNNICLISKHEESYIQNTIATHGLDIAVDYFGLGRASGLLNHVHDQFNSKKPLSCDVLVSTDTDVFHDHRLDPLFVEFDPITPFITIPLVIVVNPKALGHLKAPTSFSDLLDSLYDQKVVYGGPHNSAGKSLFKSIISAYGKNAGVRLQKQAVAMNMPAAAFHMVTSGQYPIGIVPTIFALRNSTQPVEMIWPSDGAIPIHSYVCYKQSVPKAIRETLNTHLLGPTFQQELVKKAIIKPHHPHVQASSLLKGYPSNYLEPDWNFLKAFDHEWLYELMGHHPNKS